MKPTKANREAAELLAETFNVHEQDCHRPTGCCILEHLPKLVIKSMAPERERAAREREWINDLQSGMYINCVYCGHRYGPSETTPVSMQDVLKTHVEQCPEHPMSKLRERARRMNIVGMDLAMQILQSDLYTARADVKETVDALIALDKEEGA